MPAQSLVTCGDNVKVWDAGGYSLLHQFQPSQRDEDVVADVSWSRDGGLVASVTSRQARLVVTAISVEAAPHQLTAITQPPEPTCCRFCVTTSRYICVGSHSGLVALWDNKHNKLVKNYPGHSSPISRVCFSLSDRHVASACRAGRVLVHNVTSGVMTELPGSRREGGQCARDLQYSPVRSALVGAAMDSGQLCLWDVHQTRLIHTFNTGHVAPAAGIAFSPINDILMASVGLDKRLVCYDPKSKSVIMTTVCEAPLTAVDFHPDGVHLVAGNSQGRVVAFDLRSAYKPFRTFTAHRSSVQRVQFQHAPAHLKTRTTSSSPNNTARETSAGRQPQDHSTPVSNASGDQGSVGDQLRDTALSSSALNGTGANSSHWYQSGSRHGVGGADDSSVLSPLRDDPSAANTTAGGAAAGTPGSPSLGRRPADHRDSSLFSPVRRSRIGDSCLESTTSSPPAPAAVPSVGASPTPAVGDYPSIESSPPAAALSVGPGASGHLSSSLAQPAAALSRADRSDPAGKRLLNGVAGSRPGARAATTAVGQLSESSGADATNGVDQVDGKSSVSPRTTAAVPMVRVSSPIRTRAEVHLGPQNEPAMPHTVLETLSRLVEQVDDMGCEQRQGMFSVQWDLTKQLQQMQASMDAMASKMNSLESEVTRLREENQYLNCKF